MYLYSVENVIYRATINNSYPRTKSKCVFCVVLSNKEFQDEMSNCISYYAGEIIRKYVKKIAKRMHMKLSACETVDVCEALFYYLVLNY